MASVGKINYHELLKASKSIKSLYQVKNLDKLYASLLEAAGKDAVQRFEKAIRSQKEIDGYRLTELFNLLPYVKKGNTYAITLFSRLKDPAYKDRAVQLLASDAAYIEKRLSKTVSKKQIQYLLQILNKS